MYTQSITREMGRLCSFEWSDILSTVCAFDVTVNQKELIRVTGLTLSMVVFTAYMVVLHKKANIGVCVFLLVFTVIFKLLSVTSIYSLAIATHFPHLG